MVIIPWLLIGAGLAEFAIRNPHGYEVRLAGRRIRSHVRDARSPFGRLALELMCAAAMWLLVLAAPIIAAVSITRLALGGGRAP